MPSAVPINADKDLQLARLPDSNSPTIQLVQATDQELDTCAELNGASWSGPLSLEAYLRREKHLSSQALTVNGGATVWILVDTADSNQPRRILSACESLRKRALVARPGEGIEEIISHGIGSVYCREEYRGHGYARRMMDELGKKLEFWQQEAGNRAMFNVLFSDIGKKFYAKSGWIPYLSSHISLPPSGTKDGRGCPKADLLLNEDLDELCALDERILKRKVARFPSQSSQTRVAFIPTVETMRWHHAREEFLAKETTGQVPKVKGAIAKIGSGVKAWCIWSRVFSKNKDENVLYILRLGEESADDQGGVHGDEHTDNEERVGAIESCLRAAHEQAVEWNMLGGVQIWNPSSATVVAAKLIAPSSAIEHREMDSISCLKSYKDYSGDGSMEWVANEKFAWC